ncbi:hypothetical protein M5103_004587 [Vibrio alginolyticus]|mgnify:CR=1 FL=1|uniref:hypothetical protein n=1 Tax=Gammaproteobacteria TaxID=1236 RepID=UPI000632915E|nr:MULTISPECIES: hypothetical protein [Vibrio]EKO3414946.1 hypothetical protein [Vibrio fluvialis]MBM4869310.1 hypothetical protein [Vibrio parahaemolyticus]CDT88862.1 conserved hypothetical protein [Vibrio diabolicus]EJE8156829.1 hypothetical protein [Vibrio alginolyticus]EKO3546862.1 hypothetical protein [Vibrio fluvialis]
MIVSNISEFTITGILDRGVANLERIAIYVNQTVNTGQFGVMIGNQPFGHTQAYPIKDNLLWFGDAILNQGDWIFLYTGSGNVTQTPIEGGKQLYSIYWGKPQTIFARTDIVPILFKVEAVQIPAMPNDVPQIPTNA